MQSALKIVQGGTEIVFYDDEILELPETPVGDVVVNKAQTGKVYLYALTYNFLEFQVSVKHVRHDTFSRIEQARALKDEFTLYPYLLYDSTTTVKAIMIPSRLTDYRTFGEPERDVVTTINFKESTK